ncbi:hypothetical protein KFK09_029366 [Dendrobium nobile]|uniref:Uncharacterized protein n=1 Tax=Dendrobium nobile TaxID=94219 RepID=A0A8T3A0Y0_DENNO|nr:hypothetical protein KFK09_029366 [Dendrobium nobile]
MYPLINEVTSRLCLRYDYWLRKNNQACDGSCSLRVEAKASSLRRPWLAACGGYGWLPAEAMVGCLRMSWLAACGGHGWLPAEALAGCLRRPWLAACGGAGWQRPAEALADSLRRPWLAACEGPGWQRPAEALVGIIGVYALCRLPFYIFSGCSTGSNSASRWHEGISFVHLNVKCGNVMQKKNVSFFGFFELPGHFSCY